VECEQELWLLSNLREFPINQEKYLFDIERTEDTNGAMAETMMM
jgi:hypothetical protein